MSRRPGWRSINRIGTAASPSPGSDRSATTRSGLKSRDGYDQPSFLRWAPAWASVASSEGKLTHPNERWQRFSPAERRPPPVAAPLRPEPIAPHASPWLILRNRPARRTAPRPPGSGRRVADAGLAGDGADVDEHAVRDGLGAGVAVDQVFVAKPGVIPSAIEDYTKMEIFFIPAALGPSGGGALAPREVSRRPDMGGPF